MQYAAIRKRNMNSHQAQHGRKGKVNKELALRGELPRPGRGSEGSAVAQEVINRVDSRTPAARVVAVILLPGGGGSTIVQRSAGAVVMAVSHAGGSTPGYICLFV